MAMKRIGLQLEAVNRAIKTIFGNDGQGEVFSGLIRNAEDRILKELLDIEQAILHTTGGGGGGSGVLFATTETLATGFGDQNELDISSLTPATPAPKPGDQIVDVAGTSAGISAVLGDVVIATTKPAPSGAVDSVDGITGDVNLEGKYLQTAAMVSSDPPPEALPKGQLYVQLSTHHHENIDQTNGGYWPSNEANDLGQVFEEVHPDLIGKGYTITGGLKHIFHEDSLLADDSTPLTLRTYTTADGGVTFTRTKSIDVPYTWDAATKTATIQLPADGFHIGAEEWYGIFKAGATTTNYLSIYYAYNGTGQEGQYRHIGMTDGQVYVSDIGSWIGSEFDYILDGENRFKGIWVGDENNEPESLVDNGYITTTDFSYTMPAWAPTAPMAKPGNKSVTFNVNGDFKPNLGTFKITAAHPEGEWIYTTLDSIMPGDYILNKFTFTGPGQQFEARKTKIVWTGQSPNFFDIFPMSYFIYLAEYADQPMFVMKNLIDDHGYFVMQPGFFWTLKMMTADLFDWDTALDLFPPEKYPNGCEFLDTTEAANTMVIDAAKRDFYIIYRGAFHPGRYDIVRNGEVVDQSGADPTFQSDRHVVEGINAFAMLDANQILFLSAHVFFTRHEGRIEDMNTIMDIINSITVNGFAAAFEKNKQQDQLLLGKIEHIELVGSSEHPIEVENGTAKILQAHGNGKQLNENYIGHFPNNATMDIYANPNNYIDRADDAFCVNDTTQKIAKVAEGMSVQTPLSVIEWRGQEAFTGTLFSKIKFPVNPNDYQPTRAVKPMEFALLDYESDDDGTINLWRLLATCTDETGYNIRITIVDNLTDDHYVIFTNGSWVPKSKTDTVNVNGRYFTVDASGSIQFFNLDDLATKLSATLYGAISGWFDLTPVTYVYTSEGGVSYGWQDTAINAETPPYTKYTGATRDGSGYLAGEDFNKFDRNSHITRDWIPDVKDVGLALGDEDYFVFSQATTFAPGDAWGATYSGGALDSVQIANQGMSAVVNGETIPLVVDNEPVAANLNGLSWHLPGGDGSVVTGVTGTWPVGKGVIFDVTYGVPELYGVVGGNEDLPDGLGPAKEKLSLSIAEIYNRLHTAGISGF
jgi:hypothetical protein